MKVLTHRMQAKWSLTKTVYLIKCVGVLSVGTLRLTLQPAAGIGQWQRRRARLASSSATQSHLVHLQLQLPGFFLNFSTPGLCGRIARFTVSSDRNSPGP